MQTEKTLVFFRPIIPRRFKSVDENENKKCENNILCNFFSFLHSLVGIPALAVQLQLIENICKDQLNTRIKLKFS